MKMKTLKFLVFAALALLITTSCSGDKLPKDDTPETKPRIEGSISPCMAQAEEKMPPLTDYKATIIKKTPPSQTVRPYIVSAKLFDDTEPAAYLLGGFSTYRICNYPQYAKEWDIPKTGLPVLLSGIVYPASFNPGFQLGNQAHFDLELTRLKSELP
jgi:hypothetical protein